MAASKQTILVSVGPDTDCPEALLEIPDQDVDPGELIVLRAWAACPDLLAGYAITQGEASLGAGAPNAWDGQTTCKYFDFSGDNKPQQFAFPVTALKTALAFSPLYSVSAGLVTTLAPAGADVADLFQLRGHSCLVPRAGLDPLYGTVHAVGVRAPFCREWKWTAPTSPKGAQWFFVRKDGALAHRFSLELSEDPPDTSVCYADYKIRVINRRTAGAVLGAAVTLGGVPVGVTDQTYGFVKVWRHLSGTWPIVVTAAGFPASNADGYADNDSVTLLPSGGEVRVKIGGYS